jgi:hypothetical protein
MLSRNLEHFSPTVFRAASTVLCWQPVRRAVARTPTALDKQLDDLHDLFMFRPQAVQRRFRKGFGAAHAAIALHDAVNVFEAAKFLGFAGAAMTFQLAFLGKES